MLTSPKPDPADGPIETGYAPTATGRSSRGISIIVPASNEAAIVGDALEALLASRLDDEAGAPFPIEIVVVANGCTDNTAEVALSFAHRATERGWSLVCLDIPEGDKLNALNVGDDNASFQNRLYLDADVVIDQDLLAALASVLDRPDPIYASGRLRIAEPRSFATRHYAAFWEKLPFVAEGVPGCGLFAVNAAGRALWGRFPDIISDDTFVRLQFAPRQRIAVEEAYDWPMVEGFRNLVRVRRRQDRGVRQVERLFPQLCRNDAKKRLGVGGVLTLAMRDPMGFAVYACVSLAVRIQSRSAGSAWERGR